MKQVIASLIFVFLLVSVIEANAIYAAPTSYIDPNTGGMLFQILAVAFALLSGFVLFFYRHIIMTFTRIMRFIREKMGKEDRSDSVQDSIK